MWPLNHLNSDWLPVIGGIGFLVARSVIHAILPPGYYFRFMRNVLTKRNGDTGGDDNDTRGNP